MADRILVVDDSVSMRQMVSIILKGAGYDVITAEDGPGAISKLDDAVKAVITDYNMPGMSGAELIRRIRSGGANASVPILMLTTESEEAKKLEGKEAGATGWMTKPFEKEQLIRTLQKIIGSVQF